MTRDDDDDDNNNNNNNNNIIIIIIIIIIQYIHTVYFIPVKILMKESVFQLSKLRGAVRLSFITSDIFN